jgi:DNA-directed RNA polymerase subunit F
MASPQYIEQVPMNLTQVKKAVDTIVERDEELNFRTNKVKEYLENFNEACKRDSDKMIEKLSGLGITRLKEEQMAKIIDFMPKTLEELKAILAAYPLSLSKKDQEAIVTAVKSF